MLEKALRDEFAFLFSLTEEMKLDSKPGCGGIHCDLKFGAAFPWGFRIEDNSNQNRKSQIFVSEKVYNRPKGLDKTVNLNQHLAGLSNRFQVLEIEVFYVRDLEP